MNGRARRLLIAAIAAVGGIALGASFGPTSAFWVDRGGSTMTITAIQDAPPEVLLPVTPGSGTSFTGPTWSGLGGPTTNPLPTQFCFTVVITTASIEPVKSTWTLLLHTTQPPFNNLPPVDNFKGLLYSTSGGTFTDATDYKTSGIILVTPAGEYQYASSTESYTIMICSTGVSEPAWQPPGGDTYTQLPVELVPYSSPRIPCVAGTVEGNQPFFVGFTIVFNWKDLLDAELADGNITPAEYTQWLGYNHWSGGPPSYQYGSQGATGADYVTSLQGYQAESRSVSNVENVTIASCTY